jgi:putative addiction module CopG family antidote
MAMLLSPELSARVQRWVDSGRYPDTDSVIREGLKLLNEQEKLEQLRAALPEGEEDLARGDYVEYTPDFWERSKREAEEQVARELKVSPDVLP